MAYPRTYGKGRGNYPSYPKGKGRPPVVEDTGPRPRIASPSEYQQAIFAAVEAAGKRCLSQLGNPNAEVIGIHSDARAGAGKTSTVVEKDYYLPDVLTNNSASLAFNSDIAKVLANRVKYGVKACTIHALGRGALVKAYPRLASFSALNNSKYTNYIRAQLGTERNTLVARENLKLMIDRARDFMAWTKEAMDPLFDDFEMESGHLKREEFMKMAELILSYGLNDTYVIDFADMIAMPLYHNLNLHRYAVLSVDEYQDLSDAQHELVHRSILPGGIIFTCGDEFQSIYKWRGATSDSINKGVARYNSKRFPLPRTYRCARSIVEAAQALVPDLECRDGAQEGIVRTAEIGELIEQAKPGDVILSRLNAPMLKLCFQFIRMGIPANINGRNVADSLHFMIKRSGATTVNGLLAWVDKWVESETERRKAARKPIDSIEDQAECMRTLCEGRHDLKDVADAIDQLFPEKPNFKIVLLSTTHKAKGCEWERVFMLRNTYFLQNGDEQEEKNLYYVAQTRAINELVMVTGKA